MSSEYDLNSIRDLVVHLETLVQLLYGTESQKGMLVELQESNDSFSERLSRLDEAVKNSRLALEEAAGSHVTTMADLAEQLRESVDILNSSLSIMQPAQFALVVHNRLEESIGNSISELMNAKLDSLSADISMRVSSDLGNAAVKAAQEAIVVRRQELIDEVLAASKGDMRELLAAGEYKKLTQEHEKILAEVKQYKMALCIIGLISLFALFQL